jgi:hypothetical protein
MVYEATLHVSKEEHWRHSVNVAFSFFGSEGRGAVWVGHNGKGMTCFVRNILQRNFCRSAAVGSCLGCGNWDFRA